MPRSSASSLAAFLVRFLLAPEAVLGILDLAAEVGDLILEIVDLRLERDDLDALAVGRRRLVSDELRARLGELGFLVGESALGLAQRVGLDLELVLGRAQLILDALVARFEREDRRGLFAELDLEPVDGVVLLAEFGELAGALALELVDAHLEPPRGHGEFGAQLVLVGLDFRHRERRRGLEPAHGQAHRAAMHERHDDKPDQARGQKAEPEEHDRFDHEKRLRPRPRGILRAQCHASPANSSARAD